MIMITRDELFEALRNALVKALGVKPEAVVPEASLVADFGAESLDVLDILFQIEKASGIKVSMKDLQQILRGGLSDSEFVDEDGLVTARGKEYLRTALPTIDPDVLEGDLDANALFSLITVGLLLTLLEERAQQSIVR